MANKILLGTQLNWVAEKAVSNGQLVAAGEFVGVAETDAVKGEVVTINLSGVYEVPCKDGDSFTLGAKVYLQNNGQVTTTETGNKYAGQVWAIPPKTGTGRTLLLLLK
ncbi:DUF2190 family protein [Psittacicella hinzii]|uniref:RecA/RadA recombinase n=1 Tax=Psittacicella hinzii TaxID=2028575 RepID=A0A3A1YTV7_9GAMM|nr:DUF2190 family protein [Psittacicella hinzii]RIY39487.1 hypothetical protein CKF58_02160 [Psittacicella hinzii]